MRRLDAGLQCYNTVGFDSRSRFGFPTFIMSSNLFAILHQSLGCWRPVRVDVSIFYSRTAGSAVFNVCTGTVLLTPSFLSTSNRVRVVFNMCIT